MELKGKNILIDLINLRKLISESPVQVPEGYFSKSLKKSGLKTIRELSVFRYTCRKCEEAPCIAVCPAEALEKNSDGAIDRSSNLCVSCKSCVAICPFGTLMTDFFTHHRNKDLFFDLDNSTELELFVASSPAGTVSLTEGGEEPEKNIYRLNDNVLVREYLYNTEELQK